MIFFKTEPKASTPKILILGFCSFKYLPIPEIVPPVPLAATKCVISPLVCFQISGPVVL